MKSLLTKAAAGIALLSMLFIFSSCGFDLSGSIAVLPSSVEPVKPGFIFPDISTLDKSLFVPLTDEELSSKTTADGVSYSKNANGNILINNADGTYGMIYPFDDAGDGWCSADYDKDGLLNEYMWTDKDDIFHQYYCVNSKPVRSACTLSDTKGLSKAFYSEQGSLLGIMSGSGEVSWYDGKGNKLGQEDVSVINAEFFGK